MRERVRWWPNGRHDDDDDDGDHELRMEQLVVIK